MNTGGGSWRWELTPEAFKDLVQTLGLPLALLVIVLWTGARDMWVFGSRYREMRSDRGKDIAPVKCVADRMKKEPSVRDLVNCLDAFARQSPGQNAVVRADKKAIHRLRRDGSAFASDTRINDDDMNSFLWEKSATGRQRKRACANLARRNLVREIHDVRPRLDPENDALHRAHIPVGDPEVGR